MNKADMIKEYEEQILACNQTIQQNLGVIQFCRAKIEQLNKPEEKPTEDPKP